ncbi:M-phase phosphoprotein 6 [Stomoxys calcitrans]|uniref:M-phase phosphoprotein 6 n=1 Tax=Stomoxys calcitrans TaxID=35570 RepID=A0A1I8NP60_STOCA|nr:M-phase phosphoprotein 6 [Stomoxys calcitrans]
MAHRQGNKPRLSKGILEMKFMQRTKAKVDKEIEAAEGREMYSNEITERMLNSKSNFIIEPSFVHCENLIEGRLSFRGMNPEIERLLELEREEKAGAERKDQPAEVSTEDMAKFYHVNKTMPTAGPGRTMENKFNKYKKVNGNKRHINDGRESKNNSHHGSAKRMKGDNNNNKGKFMKPKDADDN